MKRPKLGVFWRDRIKNIEILRRIKIPISANNCVAQVAIDRTHLKVGVDKSSSGGRVGTGSRRHDGLTI